MKSSNCFTRNGVGRIRPRDNSHILFLIFLVNGMYQFDSVHASVFYVG
jgi:hypothetical protein